MKHKTFILAALVYMSTLIHTFAGPLNDFVAEYGAQSAEQRVKALEKIIESSPNGRESEVALRLLADANYEIAKRRIALRMLELAESRAKELVADTSSIFSRSVIAYDALSVLHSVPLEWLPSAEREQALSLSGQLAEVLNSTAPQPVSDSSAVATNPAIKQASVDDAIAVVNKAMEAVLKEDLSIIAEAVPNRAIRKSLDQCEAAREILMSLSPDVTATSRLRWENAMIHLSSSVSLIKDRQKIKYTLWAEGLYRETDPTNVVREITDKEAVQLYRRLSEINVSLVSEPSLAREITKRLYDLYDLVPSTESKAHLRYGAIINLDQRKTFDDF